MRVLVRREDVHAIPVEEYADALRERVDCEVVVAETPSDERDLAADADVITGIHADADLLDAAGDLDLFACAYAGTDHLPVEAFRERGVAVTSAAGVHAPNVAEHAVGALLAFSRRFFEAQRRADRGEWRHLGPGELQGSTATVVGLGAIGSAVVDRLAAFDVETLGVRNSPEKGGPADEVLGPDRLHDALARSDAVVLACPLTDDTRGLLDREAFATLPPGAVLVNVARGPVVDTDALLWALRHDRLDGAALDVTEPEPLPPDHPLWDFDDVLITSHSAGSTPKYYDRLADILAENVEHLRRGEPLRNAVVDRD